MGVLRQIALSALVLLLAVVVLVFFVPGAQETLARYGIPLPFQVADATAPGATPNAGGQQRGGRRGAGEQVVVTAFATEGTINDRLAAIGEGSAFRSVTVTAPTAGTLVELLAQPGEVVEAGQVIARLDDEETRIALERAQLAARDAEASLGRNQELSRSNSVSAVALSTAQLVADNANLELRNAQLALDRRTITTPIGGTVGLFNVTPGNYVAAQSVVTTIEDVSEIVVSFWVPERYAPAITPGTPVKADAVALPGQSIVGEVSAVDNRIDPASRTLKVLAALPNENGTIRPGMSFSVNLEFAGETFPSVDPLSIQWSAEGAYVWKYADGVVKRTLVSIIQRNSDGVLVKGDLVAGDQIVTQGVQQLVDGGAVRLLDPPVESLAAGQVLPPDNQRPLAAN